MGLGEGAGVALAGASWPTPGRTGTRYWRWAVRQAPSNSGRRVAGADPRRAGPVPAAGDPSWRWRTPGCRLARPEAWWRRTAPGRCLATRSRCRRCWRLTGRTGTRAAPLSAGSVKSNAAVRPGGGGRRAGDQDGAGPAARPAAADLARGGTVAAGGLVGWRGEAADRAGAVEQPGEQAPLGEEVSSFRHRRHQRAHHPRGSYG